VLPARLRHGGKNRSAVGWELLLHADATVLNTWSAALSHSATGKSRPHLRAGMRILHSLVLSMDRLRRTSNKLRVNFGRQQEGRRFGLCLIASDVQL
jgi:hypothetical protein